MPHSLVICPPAVLVFVLAFVLSPLSRAEEASPPDRWRTCGPFQLLGKPVFENAEQPERRDAPTVVEADSAENLASRTHLKGGVELNRADQNISAEELIYDTGSGDLSTPEGLYYRAGGIAISARKAQMNLDDNSGVLEGVAVADRSQHAYMAAERLELEDLQRTELSNFTYTTCNPDSEVWRLRGGRIRLDEEEGFGTAYHTRLEIGPLPVLYLPYLKFPISDKRLTGFLMPTLSSSGERGAELRIPYYLNLDPQYDVTLTPRVMSKRGFALGAEGRYLTRNSDGNLAIDWLPEDEEYNAESRGLLVYRHASRWPNGWQAIAAIEHASDRQFFEDLGETLSVSSTTHLERRTDLVHQGEHWHFLGRLQGYQTIDDTIADSDTPYRRLPQLSLGLREPLPLGGWRFGLESEWVRFDHIVNERGDRIDLHPSLAFPLERPWGFFRPRLSLRHTEYSLTDRAAGLPTEIDRTLQTLSLDAGLFFERSFSRGGRDLIQTLEPRLFYLRTPYEDQSDLPVFDTTEPDFSMASLFRENRFSGTDRVGDADQVSVALTTRLLDSANGDERLRAGIGQIFYFRDRQVQLPGNPVATRDRSDIVGEIQTRLPRHWTLNATTQWDPDRERGNKNTLQLQYRPSRERIFNLAYRYQRDELEQTDLSFRWPLGERWHTVGRWNYSLRNERDLETFLGVEYESCCWAMRLVGRRFLNDDDATYNSSVMLQVVLKGLGRFGSSIEGILERGILGYEQDF
ncbi:MAG: LPS-assembly protein LptD [Gammaproteobacteria bacterium]